MTLRVCTIQQQQRHVTSFLRRYQVQSIVLKHGPSRREGSRGVFSAVRCKIKGVAYPGPGTKPGCIGHTTYGVSTRVPKSGCFWSYCWGKYPGTHRSIFLPCRLEGPGRVCTLGYPGTNPDGSGHTRVGTRVPPEYFAYPAVLNRVCLYSEVPGYRAWLFWSYYNNRVSTRVSPEHFITL